MSRSEYWTVACVLSLAGCSAQREPELVGEATQATNARVLPGYVHALSASHFKIGQNPTLELTTPQMQRWRGSLGAFAVDPGNGSACGLLDATSPTGPYDLDEKTNANKVKAYFVAAGLPADQVGEIQATYQSGMMGGSTVQAAPMNFQLASITSILRRRVSGVLVVESEAWATLTTSGDVDMECVFWPPLDNSAVNSAVTWAKALADGPTHAAYLAKLPGKVQRDVGVVIHHTDMSIHTPAKAYASYDAVIDTASHASARHFDQDGVEFRLPQEIAPQPAKAGR